MTRPLGYFIDIHELSTEEFNNLVRFVRVRDAIRRPWLDTIESLDKEWLIQ